MTEEVYLRDLQEQEVARIYEKLATLDPKSEDYEKTVKSLDTIMRHINEREKLEESYYEINVESETKRKERKQGWVKMAVDNAIDLLHLGGFAAGFIGMCKLSVNYGPIATKELLGFLQKFKRLKK